MLVCNLMLSVPVSVHAWLEMIRLVNFSLFKFDSFSTNYGIPSHKLVMTVGGGKGLPIELITVTAGS